MTTFSPFFNLSPSCGELISAFGYMQGDVGVDVGLDVAIGVGPGGLGDGVGMGVPQTEMTNCCPTWMRLGLAMLLACAMASTVVP